MEICPARKLANARASRHPHPAGELAAKLTTKLTVAKAGYVVRHEVTFPAGAAARRKDVRPERLEAAENIVQGSSQGLLLVRVHRRKSLKVYGQPALIE